ncbi:MAG: hypothetical protein FH751_05580 [Firmicutes bacterium]|nr:hypothetical protein [Bacillota bacterium]
MSKKSRIIVVLLVLIVSLSIGAIYTYNKQPVVSKEKLQIYKKATLPIDKSLNMSTEDKRKWGKEPDYNKLAFGYKLYYKDILINPWADEKNARENFQYKIMKLGEENYEVFLINDTNSKYIDKESGEIKKVKVNESDIYFIK